MSGSDERDQGRWPEVERRERSRRGDAERRSQASEPPAPDRRSTQRRAVGDRRDESNWTALSLDAVAEEDDSPHPLVDAAAEARTHAHARYSGFAVGAALETVDGTIVSGCNIENATYGLTLCAERVALVKALSEGHEAFTRVAVVADTQALTPPCGACRQLLWEYCGDVEVVLSNFDGQRARYQLSSLLPAPFDARLLE